MGELADDVIEGFRCSSCGQPFDDGDFPGHERQCPDCEFMDRADYEYDRMRDDALFLADD